MDGRDKVEEAKYNFRKRELIRLGFMTTSGSTVWVKDQFTIETHFMTSASPDEWMKKMKAVKDGNKFGTVE